MIFALLLASAAAVTPPQHSAPPVTQKATQNGVTVTMTATHARPTDHDDLREGDDIAIRFEVTDAAHAPLRGAKPGAWMDSKTKDAEKKTCKERVRVYASESVVERAEVDLNAFEVVTMNDDETLSVVDPRFGFGGSRLLALVKLPSPARDWTLSTDRQLWVSLPKTNQVALVDTSAWKVDKLIDVAGPDRIKLQPDEGYLWATVADGVVAIRASAKTIAAHIATGAGAHDVAFAGNRFALVTNRDAGTVSVIDIQKLRKVADLRAGSAPVSITTSPLAQTAYVASEDGTITAIAGEPPHVIAQMTAELGLSAIRSTPDGRLVLAVSPVKNRVYVVDTARNRIIQKGTIEGGPDAVFFSASLAYIRLRDGNDVQMIALAALGAEGHEISVADFPAGQANLGKGSMPTPSDSIVESVGESAVLVANPVDQAVYYYQEGMAAPMGNLSNYGKQPRALLVVDRSLREKAPGVYETVRRIEHAGDYDLALYLDAPSMIECFNVTIARDPRISHEPLHAYTAQIISVPATIKSGEPVSLQFHLSDHGAAATINDATVLIFSPMWQSRTRARSLGDGNYAIEFTPPAPGPYSAYLSSEGAGMVSTFFGAIVAR
jgi:DNA-binding beta-propeller fold protein YncE